MSFWWAERIGPTLSEGFSVIESQLPPLSAAASEKSFSVLTLVTLTQRQYSVSTASVQRQVHKTYLYAEAVSRVAMRPGSSSS